jgi:ethanolamine permease
LPESLGILEENHPMPASMALILGKENFLVQLFTFIGLFGLIASLQGIAFAATTQLEPLLPFIKNKRISKRVLASSLVFLFSLTAIWSSQTGFLIEVSVFGAVCMYLVVSASLLHLRKTNGINPSTISANILYRHSDFNPNFSSFNAWVAVIISLICIGAFAYLQFQAFIIFIACSLVYVFLIRRN